MSMQVVNQHDVESVKTSQGVTKFLVSNPADDGPNIMIRHWGPETDLAVHSHPYNEMFYVLEGEVEMGEGVYAAGTCIYIPKDTPYGPTRASKGATLLRYAEGAGG